MFVCIYICMYTHTYTQTLTHTHTYIYTCKTPMAAGNSKASSPSASTSLQCPAAVDHMCILTICALNLEVRARARFCVCVCVGGRSG